MEPLDGNVAGGMLREVFALEVTAARGRCGACGAEAFLAEARAYVDAPGLVLRCASCDNALLVLVRSDGRAWLGVQGLTWLELRA
jgi:Family of unknown function (DUF6510)